MKKKYKDRAEAMKLKKKEKLLAKYKEKEEVQEKQLKKKADAVYSLVSLDCMLGCLKKKLKQKFSLSRKKSEKLYFRRNLNFSERSLILHAVLAYLTKPN